MSIYKRFLGIIMLIVILGAAGCSQSKINATKSSLKLLVPEAFLTHYELNVKKSPTKFNVKVPETWDVQLGAYPEGLYWGLANEFSKDAGLDLTGLKGKIVEAQIYELEDGLPGSGDNARFKYPSNAILLVQDGHTVGAWLSFNTRSIGPSVRKRTLQELTGLAFEQWVARERYFTDTGRNSDLAGLAPTEVMDTFFAAINQGDKTRAVACLSPQNLLESLTMNLDTGHLYNQGFNQNNSMVENIIEAKPISYKLLDPEHLAIEIKEVGNRKRVEIAVNLYIKWRDPVFNTSDGKSVRFAILDRYENGWKLDGFGTGP